MFRSRISDLGSSEGTKIGSKETVFTVPSPSSDPSTTTPQQGQKVAKPPPVRDIFKQTITEEIYANGTNNSVDLLAMMYKIITDTMAATGGDKTKGFEACLTYLKNQGIPTVDRELARKIDRVVSATGDNLSAVIPKVISIIRASGTMTEAGLTAFVPWFESQVNARGQDLAMRRAQPPTKSQSAFAIWHKAMKRIF
ncbi:MAG: hypothetical protein R3B53_02755 [Candidatus Paceibacterota bacterium]